MNETPRVKIVPGLLAAVLVLCDMLGLCPRLEGQTTFGVPAIEGLAKGPDQINLVWAAISNPGYGYLVEIQSSADTRYSAWQEMKPIPPAGGYQCDNTFQINGAYCNISDPTGVHVYNPPTNGVPYWVTDANYIDPQDGSAAQFIAWGLKPNTSYSFRVRAYSGNASSVYGEYSNTVTVTTANYAARYVSPTGNDFNDGAGPGDAQAWRTLARATSALSCGQVLIVKGGNYPADGIGMSQNCSADNKAVVLVNPGDAATITSDSTVNLNGSYLVLDGITLSSSSASSAQNGDYYIVVNGNHVALLNVEVHPPAVPMGYGGVHVVNGDYNLVYRCYLHDFFSPDATQNPSGNGGFVLTVEGSNATGNVVWSNHLTRGGHDVSLCIRGCSYNRWLNNVMDGGWGMGLNAIQQSTHNLIEGNYIKDVGQLVAFYKPSIQISSAFNTVRRNISVNAKSNGLEVSALYGGDTAVGTLVYNNIFYSPGTCYFQSHNGGVSVYDNAVYANNICYKMTGIATDIYLANKNSQIINNDILFVDDKGVPQPDSPIIIWNHDAQGDYQYPKPLSYADTSYNPPFAHNKGLDVVPQFVDEVHSDFHLSPGSPLNRAGVGIVDPAWNGTVGATDLGAFGIASISSAGLTGMPLLIDTASLQVFMIGTQYAQTLVASGGTLPYMGWTVTAGSLPPGITLSPLGLLSGVPTTPGSFSFTVQVTDGANRTASKIFTVTVAPALPFLLASGIVNGASYSGGSVAPGEVLTIFGSGLGPSALVGLQLDSAGHVTTSLAGTQVTFDGVPAPLIYVQAGQVGTIAPYAIDGKSTTVVQVSYQGYSTSTVTLPVMATAPALFTADASGKGPGAILNQDLSVNTAANPAVAGAVVILYCTGEGQTSPGGVDGLLANSATLPAPVAKVSVTVGGQPVNVLYAGAAPGLVAGVLQVNVQLPAGLAAGNQPVVLTIGGVSSPAGVTVAVKGAVQLKPAGNLTITFSPNPVTQGSDGKWTFTATLKETAGVGVTVTQFLIGGVDYTSSFVSSFGSTYFPPNTSAAFTITATGYTPPADITWAVSGNDDNGHTGLTWTAVVHLQ